MAKHIALGHSKLDELFLKGYHSLGKVTSILLVMKDYILKKFRLEFEF